VKYTNTLSSKILLEAGYSTAYQHWTGFNQPYNDYARTDPRWLGNAQRNDSALNINPDCAYTFGCTRWVSQSEDQRTEDTRRVIIGTMSYVTGTHNIKFGVQDSFGPVHVYSDRQGDLTETYAAGKPSTVTVYTTPSFSSVHVNYDLGYFVQDSWTIKRLTLNPGLRVENFNAQIDATTNPAGRFAPARYFPEVKNVPNWNGDLAPRFSAAYDLFGNGKTALKFGWSKFWEPQTGGFPNRYVPGTQNETRTWLDCDLNAAGSACSGVALGTNGDNIAQDNEIGPTKNATFGVRPDRNPSPDIKRQSNIETTVSVSHQLTSRLSVSAGFYHRTFQNLSTTDRTNISTADYASFTLPTPDVSRDPTIGSAIDQAATLTMYNLNAAKTSVFGSGQLDINVPDQSIYNGVDMSVQGRLKGGSTVIGSWTMERNVSVFCSNNDNPNGPAVNDLYLGSAIVANGGRFCDWRNYNIPFTHEFKAAGNYPLPMAFEVGAVLQSYAGSPRVITYNPAASLFPGGVRTNSETIILNAPGSLYYPRYNQLDLNVKKNFRAGRKTFSGQVDLFNALNGNAIFARNNATAATPGGTTSLGQVTSILQGRIMRLAFQMRF